MSNTAELAKDPASPATTSYNYDIMAPRWQKIDTLLGGTEAMRAANELYLPRHTEESKAAYNERLNTSTLLNMTALTLDSWVGRPFSDPVRFKDVPQPLQDLFPDIDMQGTALEVFLRDWFKGGVAKGFNHVLVEYPRLEEKLDSKGKPIPRTREDDLKDNLRPYLVPVTPENLIFAAMEQNAQGHDVLTQIRILETVTTVVGFAEQITQQIRVMYPDRTEIWEQRAEETKARKNGARPAAKPKKNKVWSMVDSWPTSLGYIPLVTFYASKEGFMLTQPPLTDLADLNIAHWQSQSDQTTILKVARFPILALSGGSEDDANLTIGPNKWLYCPDAQGEFYYVEHEGKAISAGRQDLIDLEAQMSNYGADFLRKRPGNTTATARALDSAESTSPLQDMTIRFMAAVKEALGMMADWMKIEEGAGSVEISLDFGPEAVTNVDLNALNEARKRRDLSRSAYIAELKRRGVLADDFSEDDNDAEIEEELAEFMALAAKTDLDPGQVDGTVPSPDPEPKNNGVKDGGEQ